MWMIAPAIGFLVLIVFLQFFPIGLWITALASGVPGVTPFVLIGMKLRKVPQDKIVLPLIAGVKAGLDLSVNQLETHFMARGNVETVVMAMISAQRAKIDLTFEQASAIDLAGRNPLEAVQMSVIPRVLETPVVAGVSQDGVELKAFARVTVRAYIKGFVGGAGEATVLARVGEGIVTTIGSSATHKVVLENPDEISRLVLGKGLDAGTAFEILSVDIADVDVGDNIGARLRTAQAEADKQIAQAKAEERRVMAVAREQEMKAYVQEMRAKVVEAEAAVPLAIADALRSGKLGAMDYFSLRNLQADTEMRQGFGKMADPNDTEGEFSHTSS